MAKGGKGGGGLLLVIVVIGVIAYAAHSQHGSKPPPAGAATGGGTGKYVALGDSYTAAPGTGESAGGPKGCGRTVVNYPHLVAAHIHPASFVDASCSGATIADMTESQQVNGGENAPQLDSVDQQTTLVTLEIGGNDVGFLRLAQQCPTAHRDASPCKDMETAGGTDRLAAKADEVGRAIGPVLDEIRGKAAQAKVLVVGYPSVLPTTGDGCWPVLPYGSGDVAYLRDVLTRLNDTLSAAASAHHAGFVDVAGPSAGHDMCSPSNTRWVEGLVPASPGVPLHPNARGERGMADAVLAVLK